MPRKPALTEASLSDKDYLELSTKFKACHVKLMVYWVAKKTEAVASANPEETCICLNSLTVCLVES